MDSREALRALGGSLGRILRGHLTAKCYVHAFSDTDGKSTIAVGYRGSLPMNPCPVAHAAHGYLREVQNLSSCTLWRRLLIPGYHLTILKTVVYKH